MNRISAKIRRAFRDVMRASDFPAECLNSTPLVEVRGTEEATVSGVVRIIEYTLCEVVVDVKEFTVRINGDKLTLFSLDREKLCISGKIIGVSFEGACAG